MMTEFLKVYNILFINIYMHHKNEAALLKYKKIKLDIIHNISELQYINLNDYDYVYSPGVLIDPNFFSSKTIIIFGPHVSVFPDSRIKQISGFKNVIYIQPSEWACNVWVKSPLCYNLKIKFVPFGIDTDKFSPSQSLSINSNSAKTEVFIYFKRRHPAELEVLKTFLNDKNIKFIIFDYVKKYREEDFLHFLKTEAKYGIWLGSHESQGFALQEILSCNIPLLVWNATNMNQEYNISSNPLPNIEATSIPYWDNSCGEYFTMFYELDKIFSIFINKITNKKYTPRQFILDNLSIEKCENKFCELLRYTSLI